MSVLDDDEPAPVRKRKKAEGPVRMGPYVRFAVPCADGCRRSEAFSSECGSLSRYAAVAHDGLAFSG